MNLLLVAVFAFIGIVLLAIVLFFLWRLFQKSVKFYKETAKGSITLHVKANCDVRKITVVSNKGKLQLVRTKVAPGEEVEFIFPESKAKLVVECTTGTYEYEVN